MMDGWGATVAPVVILEGSGGAKKRRGAAAEIEEDAKFVKAGEAGGEAAADAAAPCGKRNPRGSKDDKDADTLDKLVQANAQLSMVKAAKMRMIMPAVCR